MSILIAHPSVAPFVQQAGKSLYEADLLGSFHTTFYYEPESTWQRAAYAASKLMGRNLEPRFKRRVVADIPAEFIKSHPWRELVRLGSGSLDKSGRLADSVWEWAELGFDRAVSRQVSGSASAVYGYEHCCEFTFKEAKRRSLKTIYDVPAPEPQSVEDMLDREVAKYPILDTQFHRHTRSRIARRIERRHNEWKNADLVIAASSFTRQSFANAGLDTAKVRIIPYGAPPPLSRDEAIGEHGNSERVRLIWAGTLSVRKGAHYLIEAWRRFDLGKCATLDIFGTNGLPESLFAPWPDGITYKGPIARSELMKEYKDADALIFPTLCDGFGMVATEAWACGCPVITTACAGAIDFLRTGENGLVISPGRPDAIAEAIIWCQDNRSQLRAMRETSLATAGQWQWKDYRLALARAVREATGATPSI